MGTGVQDLVLGFCDTNKPIFLTQVHPRQNGEKDRK